MSSLDYVDAVHHDTRHFTTDSYRARLIQVARAYYLENQTQEAIAHQLGVSRSLISRYLTAAREQGIVRIEIVDSEETDYTLAEYLKARFPSLQHVIVAHTIAGDERATRSAVGRAAAQYLVTLMQPGTHLTLGCGRTLRALVDALPKRRFPGSIVVQAMGNIGHEANEVDYNLIAQQTGDALGAQVYYLSAPAILGKRAGRGADWIAMNPTLSVVLSLAKAADIYVLGVGSVAHDLLYVRSGLIDSSEMEALEKTAVGDICGHFFNIDGIEQIAPFTERLVGIDLADLHRRAGTSVIGVAGGEDKVRPIIGALAGGHINTLVTDRLTLEQVIHIVQEEMAG